MGGDGAIPKEGRAAARAFMDRLDRLTTAIYPHEIAPDCGPDPDFTLDSWAVISPVLVGLFRLTVQVLRPYVVVALFVLAGLGISSVYCATAGAALLAYLCFFDPAFRQAVLTHGVPAMPPGLYCQSTPRTGAIISMVPALQSPHYRGTPWIFGGDMATIYPFLAFSLPSIEYVRRWLTVDADNTKQKRASRGLSGDKDVSDETFDGSPYAKINGDAADDENGDTGGSCDDKEAVAMDVALPDTGLDPSKPFYIVLHGLNGGSTDSFTLDFATNALKRGCGVCVMINRGCMKTPVRGQNMFHGARISDVTSAMKTLRQSLPAGVPIAMVGFSMGGVIAANYAASLGGDSGLSCCVSMSGSLDTRVKMSARSVRSWQPMLALGLKEHVVTHTKKIAARGIDLSKVASCRNVVEFETNVVAPYNGYPSVMDYYADMSAAAEGKLARLRTPMLAVLAADDPIITSSGTPMEELGKIDKLLVLVTRTGGHVGWPTGWFPTRNKWSWMSSTSLDFCEAAVATAHM